MSDNRLDSLFFCRYISRSFFPRKSHSYISEFGPDVGWTRIGSSPGREFIIDKCRFFMRAVIQRVSRASVIIEKQTIRSIDRGLVVLIGIHPNDTIREIEWMSEKITHLRIFEDGEGKMNRSLQDIGGQMLIVSQFTLYGDCRKGRRPGYSAAAPPSIAEPVYQQFVQRVKAQGITVETGSFQASMEVELVNDGPVTLLLDSEKQF